LADSSDEDLFSTFAITITLYSIMMHEQRSVVYRFVQCLPRKYLKYNDGTG